MTEAQRKLVLTVVAPRATEELLDVGVTALLLAHCVGGCGIVVENRNESRSVEVVTRGTGRRIIRGVEVGNVLEQMDWTGGVNNRIDKVNALPKCLLSFDARATKKPSASTR